MKSWLPASIMAAVLVLGATPLAAQIGELQINRPRSEFQCDTPLGVNWYGSTERCLQELCAGKNVTNEYIFDSDTRRRHNPCYRQNPTSVED